ncbi:GNAT family N-acetyltransferase [Amycolatopsis sp. A1MSW2902]|uniref:GNAT family N-acetyltransferase n=1 Tax=Amycolatopsis sp. A1MSW2902 TaxID=687413 RepID=UPI00307FAE7F
MSAKREARSGIGHLDAARYEVQRRPLTPREADVVLDQIGQSAAITGYSRAEWRGKRDVFALMDRSADELIAVVLVHRLSGGWSEIAVVFVLEGHRGQGHGTTILRFALRTLSSDGRRKLLLFSDDTMAHLARICGFTVFDSEHAYLSQHPKDRFFMRFSYKAQWLANAYRLRELRRKRAELGSTFTFKIGVLDS